MPVRVSLARHFFPPWHQARCSPPRLTPADDDLFVVQVNEAVSQPGNRIRETDLAQELLLAIALAYVIREVALGMCSREVSRLNLLQHRPRRDPDAAVRMMWMNRAW